ncbi:hypothetical protein [Streptomyces reniochalinae]|uniref:hypothetical protein n=1 Tax=Streptomyces reniochalinae TaxID=2250578 RepID=UPI001FE36AA2|nr:hypothetical protein [Streptomyces reniochalinae]
MLALGLEDYRRYAPDVVGGFDPAATFLRQQFVFDTRFLPYGAQLIPPAATFALAGKDAKTAGAQDNSLAGTGAEFSVSCTAAQPRHGSTSASPTSSTGFADRHTNLEPSHSPNSL